MAFNDPQIKLSWNWEITGTDEIGTSGVSLVQTGGILSDLDWFAAQTANIEDFGDAIEAFWSSADSCVPQGCKLTSVKMALLDLDGHYQTEAVESPLTATGFYANQFAAQLAVVTTLDTGKFKAPGKYGRFYTPVAIVGGGTDYFLSPTTQGNYLDAAVEFIDAINAAADIPVTNGKARVAAFSSVGSGSSLNVTSVKLGRLYDTQRRRRNQLTENYMSAPVS